METLLGDPAKAKAKLGWVPKTSFDQLVTEMVEADYELRQARCPGAANAATRSYNHHE